MWHWWRSLGSSLSALPSWSTMSIEVIWQLDTDLDVSSLVVVRSTESELNIIIDLELDVVGLLAIHVVSIDVILIWKLRERESMIVDFGFTITIHVLEEPIILLLLLKWVEMANEVILLVAWMDIMVFSVVSSMVESIVAVEEASLQD